jgi:F420-non-reducing hydrogenase large subunit
MKQITIDPITRLEGHGKIEIFLKDDGEVENVYFQVPELRGFEKFCEGRPVEELAQIVTKICGVCPGCHHMASGKAADAGSFSIWPTSCTAILHISMPWLHLILL